MIKWRNVFIADAVFVWVNGLAGALSQRADETALQGFFYTVAGVCAFALLPFGAAAGDQAQAERQERYNEKLSELRKCIEALTKERDELIDRYLEIEARWTSGGKVVPERPDTSAFAEGVKRRRETRGQA